MRIVAVADTHVAHDQVFVPDGDVFIHAGDLCSRGELAELRATTDWIRGLPHRHKLVVAGNHDFCVQRSPAEAWPLFDGMTYLADAAITIDGVRFHGSPWQPVWRDMAFNLPRGEAIAAMWRLIPEGLDVLITHGPPHGLGDRLMDGAHTGCADLLARVAQVAPRLHLFGHMHEDGGVWQCGPTLCANVTVWNGRRAPTVFELDDATVVATVVPPSLRPEPTAGPDG